MSIGVWQPGIFMFQAQWFDSTDVVATRIIPQWRVFRAIVNRTCLSECQAHTPGTFTSDKEH